jgi:membrane-anchored glycerophosphoryl diester phosphodiesterase (GDPDase)
MAAKIPRRITGMTMTMKMVTGMIVKAIVAMVMAVVNKAMRLVMEVDVAVDSPVTATKALRIMQERTRRKNLTKAAKLLLILVITTAILTVPN